jgi:xylose isomerase
MRTYKILQEKARQFNEDREIQAAVEELQKRGAEGPHPPTSYSREAAQQLKDFTLNVDEIAGQGLGYEHLDQLTTELLLGVR